MSMWAPDRRQPRAGPRILEEAGVAVTPGLDFDKGRGHRTLRLSYARGTAEIEEGVARLTRFFAGG
jgi:aspartate/methionine/tyrosine aminotransferase